jgi:hypothetical protein
MASTIVDLTEAGGSSPSKENVPKTWDTTPHPNTRLPLASAAPRTRSNFRPFLLSSPKADLSDPLIQALDKAGPERALGFLKGCAMSISFV